MYEKIIKELNPKPKFNLKWYKEEDLYSEGEIEDIIINLIVENKPEEYIKAISEQFNWSTYYHLTHLRKNILNWYAFDKEATVLEIGCGLGAITSVLCENCKEVTAVELSKKRATAALLRCREKDNLEIIVGNLNDIKFDKKFDYITLIGVLEYQGSYTNTSDPYCDFLKKIKGLLKPEGKLLIAIENQYGLKYWCGAREDHTGIPFDGMNQYTLTERKIRTFSKKALENLIKRSGFKRTYFYYPMPDYKLPTVIYSQDFLPRNENMQNVRYYYVPDKATLLAQEEKIYKDIIQNNVFEFFSNSYLVECSDSDDIGKIIFASMSSERIPEYRIGTRFTKDNKVEKFSLVKSFGENHIVQIKENENNLKMHGIKVCPSKIEGRKIILDYIDAPLCEEYLLNLLSENKLNLACKIWDNLYEQIIKSSEEVTFEKNILYTFGLKINSDREVYGNILKTGYLDMILRNAFFIEEKMYWFDQEWILENIPAKYILYRALKEFYISFPDMNKKLPMEKMIKRYHMQNIWKDFETLEALFVSSVMDQKHLSLSNVFRGSDKERCISNINKILNI